ncbi:acyl-CoA carboxylase subunit epsilon [Streptomyces violarus]|uniref:acyl-CoA carboxylase subunit epsilon n=1 Tax=Streptomyces violarus TaxID=67380 RepID=UPI0021BE9FB3|nr:acyl-CoA carboxylase subunit epsilon [Streptomyces violarus]MCT9137787.1 acyl-CoA carboxylase subunit epsilon [Streptomyces violarus]
MPLPLVTVLRGRPTAEELAAVIAVLQTRATATPLPAQAPARPRRSPWNDRASAIEMQRLSRTLRYT